MLACFIAVIPHHLFNRSKSIVEGAVDVPSRHNQQPRYSEGMLEPGMYTRSPGPLSIPTSHLARQQGGSAESLVGQVNLKPWIKQPSFLDILNQLLR